LLLHDLFISIRLAARLHIAERKMFGGGHSAIPGGLIRQFLKNSSAGNCAAAPAET
jgi:hypothetical protein